MKKNTPPQSDKNAGSSSKKELALDSFDLFYEEMPLKTQPSRSSTRLQRPSRKN